MMTHQFPLRYRIHCIMMFASFCINPNCTGLYCAMKILGGGGGGGGSEAPLQISAPKWQVADRREIWHAPPKLCKEKNFGVIFLKNCIFF